MRIKKEEAKKVYIKLLMKVCGMSQEDAEYNSEEKVVSGVKLNRTTYLIKIIDDIGVLPDNFGFQPYCFEHVSFTNKGIQYKSLVKKGSKYYPWSDDCEVYKNIKNLKEIKI